MNKLETRKKRFKQLHKELKKHFSDSKLALKYKNQWQLMVAVQLSAQSTDKKVNEITKDIFKKYKSVKDFANADIKDLEKSFSSVLYYRNKAKNVKRAAQFVLEKHNGKLPKTMKEMLEISGVARKTANVLLGTLFEIKEGIVVDTHMIRFARRFDLSDFKVAEKIEKDLMQIIDKKDWYKISYMVVDYGRSFGNPRGKKEIKEKDPLIKHFKLAKNYWP